MCVSAPKLCTNHKFSNLEQQIIKKNYILIAILLFAHMKVNVASILDFFHFNLLVINVNVRSTKLQQINHIIVKMIIGILRVTVDM